MTVTWECNCKGGQTQIPSVSHSHPTLVLRLSSPLGPPGPFLNGCLDKNTRFQQAKGRPATAGRGFWGPAWACVHGSTQTTEHTQQPPSSSGWATSLGSILICTSLFRNSYTRSLSCFRRCTAKCLSWEARSKDRGKHPGTGPTVN